ncbi:MAG: flap endonuclease-1 [Halobacteriales archaeon]
MGVDLGDIVVAHETPLEEVGGRVGIDAYNALYGFLANIRGRDGEPLKDSKGRVTSHLSGLLYRTANLYEAGIKPCYVFDGEPPALKRKTLEERDERRTEAEEAYEEAARRGDEAAMLKHAQQATRLEPPQVETAVALLDALNVPWLEAPAEGEAQAARMCRDDALDSVGSQDYDALLFGAPTLVRNLTVRGRGGNELTPDVIDLQETLDELGLTREQLVEVAVLVGTDYNKGIHGYGPKTALDTVRDGGFDEAVDEHDDEFAVDVDEVKSLFLEPETTGDYALDWEKPDTEAAVSLLVDEHDFSRDRVTSAVERIEDATTQSSLDRWS